MKKILNSIRNYFKLPTLDRVVVETSILVLLLSINVCAVSWQIYFLNKKVLILQQGIDSAIASIVVSGDEDDN